MNDESLDRITELALRKIESQRVPIAMAASAPAPPRADSLFHRLASVLSSFRPDDLRKLAPDTEGFETLLSDSAPLDTGDMPGHWTLLPAVRASVIARMAPGQLSVAVIAARKIAAEDDPLIEALHLLLRPQNSIDALSIPALAAISPIVPALPTILEWAPSQDDVERRLEFLRLLQPFERLVGTHFAGRKAELQQLSDYVGVLPAGSTYEAISRMVFTRKAPLLLYGAGGVGKSTLVAKFILMHATLPESKRFPFAYLDFDRPALLASEPATILVEAVRQIGLQYPVAYNAAQRLRAEWNEKLQESGRRRGPVRKTAGSADRSTRKRVLDEFVRFLGTLDVVRGPLLLVLDTFEEVQHRSDVYVGELMKFLDELGHAVPRLRTILSGRAEVPGIHVDSKLPLTDFDNAAAVGFLLQRGVVDPDIANAIVKQVGGNPLTLHLAAAVAAGEGVTKDGISDLETHTAFGLIRVKKRHIQGQLFQRILNHIHDADVVKIAHPGLVLRRVTADLIQKVLAKPCGIDVPTKERAEELFAKLRKEVALVSPAGEGVLEHRADVRRLMLDALRETRPRETREIDELAASYYAEQPGVIPRAEEIYHRLMLGEPHDEIAAMFLDGVEDYLGGAIEELPAPEKAFLAEKLGVALPPDAKAGATQQVWERTAIRRIEEALEAEQPEAALKVLAERKERSAQTMLRVHEVIALTAAQKFDEAARAATAALEAYAGEGNLLGVFETLLANAEALRRRGDYIQSLATLDGAEDLARTTRDSVQLLRVAIAQALAFATDKRTAAIVEAAAKIDDDVFRESPVLLRLAGALSHDRHLMARAIRVTGLPRLRHRQQETLRHYLDLPLDEERIAALVEKPPANSASYVLSFIGDILRNDTYAEALREEEAGRGAAVEVQDHELTEHMLKLDLVPSKLRRIFASIDYSIDSLAFETMSAEGMTDAIISRMREEGTLATLIDLLRKNAHAHTDFLRFADRLGIGIAVEELRGDSLSRKFLDTLLNERRSELAAVESRICRVENAAGAVVGTGFLIGPSLVVSCARGATRVRFDSGEKDGTVYASGTFGRVITTIEPPGGEPRPSLLQLERPVALEPVRGDAEGKPRGHFEPNGVTVKEGQSLIWLWYERGELRLGGTAQVIRPDDRQMGFPVRPRDSFAGAPVFNLDLELVALHCGAHRRLKRECIARPMAMIADLVDQMRPR